MITEVAWQELAKRTGLAADKLQEAISSEKEEPIELPNMNVLSDDELTTLKETFLKVLKLRSIKMKTVFL